MFWSNFSGGWGSYLEDFIEKIPVGLTGIWSNTRGFPRTKFLFFDGAKDGERFLRWERRQQYAASFWYSGYPDLPLNRIRRNAAIRQGIADARTEADAQTWLACFGSEPRPSFMLDKPQIPTLVMGGLGRLRHAVCLILRLPDDPAVARTWLGKVVPDVTFGEGKQDRPAAAIAFTMQGLRRLGMDEEDLQTFPVAFQNGMTSPGRSQALGDKGRNAPEEWRWGKRENTDAVLMLYDCNPDRLTERMRATEANISQYAGGSVQLKQRLRDLSLKGERVFEPFGFADGISQPILRDTPRARNPHNDEHVVEAGELVLGYPDGSGYLPSTPTVRPKRDPHRKLVEMAPQQPGVPPSFAGGGSDGRRDFGRDGTFLVVRHLEQNPERFHDFTAAEARRLSDDGGCPFFRKPVEELQKLLEAKMVGRWHDGGSLVRHAHPNKDREAGPHKDGKLDKDHQPDNDFTFNREDPQGLACPFGSHVRRTNPRDSLDTDPDAKQRLAKRHRILRVGRQYEANEQNPLPGLMFMCLNANIERQFEFLQQNWVMGRSFNNLQDEQDPMLSNSSAERVFTIPTWEGQVQLRGLPDCVRVRGGGDFFMPGRRTLGFLAGG